MLVKTPGVKKVKKVGHSLVAEEIKKEYLKEHLDKVKGLIETWISQLSTPGPFSPQEVSFGWKSVYIPSVEQDADSNHMLRSHLKSRALWRHHADWERGLEDVWRLSNQIRQQAREKLPPPSAEEQESNIDYPNYLGTAIWIAFELALDRKVDKPYKLADDGKGIAIGAYRITPLAMSAECRSSFEKRHWGLVKEIASGAQMKELCEVWREVDDIQNHMQAIASKILKSNDILYPCRFCRHLWK